jgi:hypothetical protein
MTGEKGKGDVHGRNSMRLAEVNLSEFLFNFSKTKLNEVLFCFRSGMDGRLQAFVLFA